MHVEVIDDIGELHALEPAWTALADACGARVYDHPWWALPWWEHLGRGTLAVAAVREGSDLVGLGLFHEVGPAGGRIVRFLGHGLGSVHRLLVSPGRDDVADALWRSVLGRPGRVVQLFEYEEAAPGLDLLRRRVPSTCRVTGSEVCRAAELCDSFEQYWASRPKNLRRTVRRAQELAAESGIALEVDVVTSSDAVPAALEKMAAVFGAAERAHPRLNFFEGAYREFARTIVASAVERGSGWVVLVEADGDPIATETAFVGGRTATAGMARYDPAFARYSPGHLAARASFEQAFATGLAEMDLSVGDQPYKRLWTEREYRTVDVWASSSRLRYVAGETLMRALVKWRGRNRAEGATGSESRPAP